MFTKIKIILTRKNVHIPIQKVECEWKMWMQLSVAFSQYQNKKIAKRAIRLTSFHLS